MQTIYYVIIKCLLSYNPESNENNFSSLPIIVSKETNINLPKRKPFQIIKFIL